MDEKWMKDTGVVASLILLFIGYGGDKRLLIAAGVVLLITAIYPRILFPVAFLWWKVANVLSVIVPRFLFAFVFAAIIFPIALTRKVFGGDSFMLKYKKYRSGFIERSHLYTKQDLSVLH